MDLLGGLGDHDQLVSARAENAVLSKKVKELTEKVKSLELDNFSLLAEVEMYRKGALLSSEEKGSIHNSESNSSSKVAIDNDDLDSFVRSGNRDFVTDPVVTLFNPSGISNPICCSMDKNDTLLVVGGADSKLSLFSWGAALAPSPDAAKKVVDDGIRSALHLGAPVIATCFSQTSPFVAAGCMDGSVHVASFQNGNSCLSAVELSSNSEPIKHSKYVKCLEWSPSASILASASADGVILLTKVVETAPDSYDNDLNQTRIKVDFQRLEAFHLDGAIESMCFLDNGNTLCCYSRGTPYLSYFHLDDSCALVKHSLNGKVTGGFDTHVSFTVMSLSPSPDNNGKYIAAATDTSRNIILQANSPKQIRNLYGKFI